MKRYLKWILFAIAITSSFTLGNFSLPLKEWKIFRFARIHNKPVFSVAQHKPFVIIIPSYNNSEWVEKNLSSIFAQKYDNYRVIYIDDASNDGTLKLVKEYLTLSQMEHRVDLIHNESNRGACENIYRAVHTCDEDEIAIVVDGDDWFAHDRVLARLNEIYANPDIWLTYGSYIEYPSYSYTVANFAQPIPKSVMEKNALRKYSREHWCFSQLRTFYAGLFQKIQKEDLQLEEKFYPAAYDVAFMIPMVEMAREHVKYVEEVFYIYNRATPLNDNKIRAKQQQQIAQHIFDLPAYPALSTLKCEGRKCSN